MARRQKLKVFRTPTGFHDAYVAAPSRKAALEAWGSDADLFARGVAELVTDEELSREPLEHPGKVIRRLRGTAEEQLAALPADPPKRRKPDVAEDEPEPKRKPSAKAKPTGRASRGTSREQKQPKRKPRPSRDRLEALEQALIDLAERQRTEEAEIRARQRDLERERRDLEAAHEKQRAAAERDVEEERKAHSERLERWIKSQG